MKRVIKVRNISKTINKKKILDNINFDIYEGEIVGLVGKNGAGKSTLLKIMTGLYSYDEGEIYYYNYNLKTDYEKAMSIVGTLIENPDMYSNLTGKKNLELFKSMFKGIDEGTVEEIVRIVEMEKYLGKKFKTYSLGMKERLGIASSLINKPKILILDEATSSLDTETEAAVMEAIDSLQGSITMIIIAHRLSTIKNSDCIMVLEQGRIIERGSHDELLQAKGKYYQLYTG